MSLSCIIFTFQKNKTGQRASCIVPDILVAQEFYQFLSGRVPGRRPITLFLTCKKGRAGMEYDDVPTILFHTATALLSLVYAAAPLIRPCGLFI